MRARLRGRAQESLVVCRGWLVGRSIREEREWIGRRRKRHEGRHVKASKDAAHHAGKRVKTVSFGTVIWRTLEYVCQVSDPSGRALATAPSRRCASPRCTGRTTEYIYSARVLSLSHALTLGHTLSYT